MFGLWSFPWHVFGHMIGRYCQQGCVTFCTCAYIACARRWLADTLANWLGVERFRPYSYVKDARLHSALVMLCATCACPRAPVDIKRQIKIWSMTNNLLCGFFPRPQAINNMFGIKLVLNFEFRMFCNVVAFFFFYTLPSHCTCRLADGVL